MQLQTDLHRWEGDFADTVLGGEAKDPSDLVHVHASLDAGDVAVKGAAHVVKVREDEGPGGVKAAGDDVLGVFAGQPAGLLHAQPLPQELFVVGELHHQRHLERVLQPLGEHEGDEVAQVEGLGGGAAAGVQVEGLAALVGAQELCEVSASWVGGGGGGGAQSGAAEVNGKAASSPGVWRKPVAQSAVAVGDAERGMERGSQRAGR